MSGTILNPLSNGLYTVGTGVIHFFPFETDSPDSIGKGYRLGDADSLSVEVSVEEGERYSNEYGVRRLALKSVQSVDTAVNVTLAQLSEIVRAAALMGSKTSFAQDEITDQVMNIGEVKAGDVFDVGAYGLTSATVEDGASAMTQGVDYVADMNSGLFEIMSDMTNAEITFSAPEISDRFATGVASGTGIRGMLKFVGVNTQGVKAILEIWDVALRPSGAREYISDSGDIQTVELTGTASPVNGKPSGFEVGREMNAS